MKSKDERKANIFPSVPKTEIRGPPPKPKELIGTLINGVQSKYVSKKCLQGLLSAAEKGNAAFLEEVERRYKNDNLLLNEFDLARIELKLPNRSEIVAQFADMLLRASLMEPDELQQSLKQAWKSVI